MLVGAGVGLRVIQYLANRSLWLDEALLAPEVLHRSAGEILSPRNWGPVPAGFLLLTRVSTEMLGRGELALRLVPLAAGVASVFLFIAVAKRLVSPAAALVGLALFSLSPFLVYYSSELKPYSTDVALALAVVLLGLRMRRGGGWRSAVWIGIAGAAAVLFSQTAALVLAGVTLAVLVDTVKARDRAATRMILWLCVFWAALFGVPFFLFLRHAGMAGYIREFWSSGFMPLPPTSVADLKWFPDTFLRLFRDPLGVLGDRQIETGFYHAAAGMAAFLVGSWRLWRRDRATLRVLLLPVAVTLIASGLERYPFGGEWTTSGRVILFLAPLLFLVIGVGAAELLRRLRGVGIGVVCMLVAPFAAYALLATPSGRVEIRPLLDHLAENRGPGEPLYVHYKLKPAFRYYAESRPALAKGVLLGTCARARPSEYLRELAGLRGNERVWILFGEGSGAQGLDEKGLMLAYLDQVGERLDGVVAQGTSLYLYDLRPERAQPSIRIPAIPELVVPAKEDCAVWL